MDFLLVFLVAPVDREDLQTRPYEHKYTHPHSQLRVSSCPGGKVQRSAGLASMVPEERKREESGSA